MKTLAPVDFKAVAAEGCFVYCYLRARDSATGKAGTPYYVGFASNPERPLDKWNHKSAPVPSDPRLIRVLKGGLSMEAAFAYERFFIARYGRKDAGTGILLNLTDGGEGAPGRNVSEHTKSLMSARNKGKRLSDETKALLRAAALLQFSDPEARAKHGAIGKGRKLSEEHKAKISALSTGRRHSPEAKEKMRAAALNRSVEHTKKISEANKGRKVSDETRARISEANKGRKYDSDAYASRRGRVRSPEMRARMSAARRQNGKKTGQ